MCFIIRIFVGIALATCVVAQINFQSANFATFESQATNNLPPTEAKSRSTLQISNLPADEEENLIKIDHDTEKPVLQSNGINTLLELEQSDLPTKTELEPPAFLVSNQPANPSSDLIDEDNVYDIDSDPLIDLAELFAETKNTTDSNINQNPARRPEENQSEETPIDLNNLFLVQDEPERNLNIHQNPAPRPEEKPENQSEERPIDLNNLFLVQDEPERNLAGTKALQVSNIEPATEGLPLDLSALFALNTSLEEEAPKIEANQQVVNDISGLRTHSLGHHQAADGSLVKCPFVDPQPVTSQTAPLEQEIDYNFQQPETGPFLNSDDLLKQLAEESNSEQAPTQELDGTKNSPLGDVLLFDSALVQNEALKDSDLVNEGIESWLNPQLNENVETLPSDFVNEGVNADSNLNIGNLPVLNDSENPQIGFLDNIENSPNPQANEGVEILPSDFVNEGVNADSNLNIGNLPVLNADEEPQIALFNVGQLNEGIVNEGVNLNENLQPETDSQEYLFDSKLEQAVPTLDANEGKNTEAADGLENEANEKLNSSYVLSNLFPDMEEKQNLTQVLDDLAKKEIFSSKKSPFSSLSKLFRKLADELRQLKEQQKQDEPVLQDATSIEPLTGTQLALPGFLFPNLPHAQQFQAPFLNQPRGLFGFLTRIRVSGPPLGVGRMGFNPFQRRSFPEHRPDFLRAPIFRRRFQPF